MTVEQFYDGPANLTVAFRKAHRRRREEANFDAYLQGAYTYRAILACRQFYNSFVKEPKADDWMSEPFDVFGTRDRGRNMDDDNGKAGDNSAGVAFLESFMARHNASLTEKRVRSGDEEK